MQIFSPSPIVCSSDYTKKSLCKGFTLIELLISCGIIAIISSIVLLKYSAFDSTVLLKGTAYEIALTLRDAQVKSVSAARSGSEADAFNFPYGVTFTPGQKTYTAFRYKHATNSPYYDIAETDPDVAEDIQQFTIGRSMQVSDICYTISNTETCHSTDSTFTRLDVSFRRPEFKALFYAERGATDYSTTITSAKIKVNSTQGAGIFIITVSKLGQISVKKE